MKIKKFIGLLLFFCMALIVFPMRTNADTGPKPSIRITFENLGDEECWGTLLSNMESTGPFSAWDGNAENGGNQTYGYDIWKAFVDYAENDDFYFLQEAWQINDTKELAWTYYPPTTFKILLYFPKTGEFAVSGVYERYAFDSYFTANMEGAKLFVDYNEEISSETQIHTYNSYNYPGEIMALIARIIITIIIEMAIAWMFGYREKKQLQLLAGMNVGTQILLNVLLNRINYNSGRTAFVLIYILFEMIVVIIEAMILLLFLNKMSIKQSNRGLMIVYVLLANAASFFVGMYLADWLPGIF